MQGGAHGGGQRGRRTTSFFKCQRGRRTTSLFFIGRWPGSSPGGGRVLIGQGTEGRVLHRRRTGSSSGGGRVLHRAAEGFFTGRRTGSSPGGRRVLHRAADAFFIGQAEVFTGRGSSRRSRQAQGTEVITERRSSRGSRQAQGAARGVVFKGRRSSWGDGLQGATVFRGRRPQRATVFKGRCLQGATSSMGAGFEGRRSSRGDVLGKEAGSRQRDKARRQVLEVEHG